MLGMCSPLANELRVDCEKSIASEGIKFKRSIAVDYS